MPDKNKYDPNRKVSAEAITLLLNRLQAGGFSDDSLKVGRNTDFNSLINL